MNYPKKKKSRNGNSTHSLALVVQPNILKFYGWGHKGKLKMNGQVFNPCVSLFSRQETDRTVGPYLPTPAPIADLLCLDAKQTEQGEVFLENAG